MYDPRRSKIGSSEEVVCECKNHLFVSDVVVLLRSVSRRVLVVPSRALGVPYRAIYGSAITGTSSQVLCWATSWENLFMSYANNKGADQPAHVRSLISAFVVCCLDSIIPLVSISEIFKPLGSFCSCAGQFESYLVENPEDRFSRDEAHIYIACDWTSADGSFRVCILDLSFQKQDIFGNFFNRRCFNITKK